MEYRPGACRVYLQFLSLLIAKEPFFYEKLNKYAVTDWFIWLLVNVAWDLLCSRVHSSLDMRYIAKSGTAE